MNKPNKHLRIIAAVAILAISLGCGSPGLDPLPDDGIILAFGDSLTAGVGTTSGKSYPAVLGELTGLKIINAGISGETTDEGLQRLPQELDESVPDLIIILEGGNDFLQDRDASTIKNNIKQMIEISKSRGIQVVLIGVPQKSLLSTCAPLYKELADDFQLVFDGTLISRLQRSRSLKSDYVHFNEKGYRKMAESIFTLLKEKGAL
jgi:lysophospholipase L1-like esterase